VAQLSALPPELLVLDVERFHLFSHGRHFGCSRCNKEHTSTRVSY
jgi:hypothetical protein